MGSTSDDDILDALILVDSATNFGGVWYWNRYPGARVDSTVPHYEFSDPALWKDWSWKQRFPGSQELREYFAFVADKWDLRKDTEFNTFISQAIFDERDNLWHISSSCGKKFVARYFLLNTGFSAKRHIPNWKGIDKFRGTWIHPSYWPKEEPDLKGKKVAVIGTGSTGVQLAQELSQVAGEFVLFQRTPNLALPMGQINFKDGDQGIPRKDYPDLFNGRRDSYGGFNFNFTPRSTFDDSPEKRKETYEELWKHGDFHFWLASYQDMMFTKEANKEAYDFWKSKVRPRIHDPRLRDILAPEIQPHGFGCKRISLENGFYEIFNQPNTSLVDVKSTPIVEVTERGIKTTEKEWEFDYVVCATGFDADGTKTYLGMAVSGFPNMFFTYGPQAPTALCNGPTCAEYQGDFVIGVMEHMRKTGKRRIEAGADAEQLWGNDIRKFAYSSLLPETDSWYMGTNIPGKVREPLVYFGGVPNYYKSLDTCLKGDFAEFQQS
ncbi:hypothetical protein N7494_007192 [Penicillium frequentans]|uniref:FAD/NAD(P)-binding domain-containing protein n=1 Tax=Penicillium frequentans TaxID=3151616 RepID=A0AAD6CSE4_9EURO|nr:hypothetical protein N7494_007192 [Penicillium glabrum]